MSGDFEFDQVKHGSYQWCNVFIFLRNATFLESVLWEPLTVPVIFFFYCGLWFKKRTTFWPIGWLDRENLNEKCHWEVYQLRINLRSN